METVKEDELAQLRQENNELKAQIAQRQHEDQNSFTIPLFKLSIMALSEAIAQYRVVEARFEEGSRAEREMKIFMRWLCEYQELIHFYHDVTDARRHLTQPR